MIGDAYRALELLATHPRIDAARIGVLGWSKGGGVSLYASVKRFQRLGGLAGVEFAIYLPFYPSCNTRWVGDEGVSDRPIRIFHGEADDQALYTRCREYAERLRGAGKDAEIVGYPGAAHGFDDLSSPRTATVYRNRQNFSQCSFDEARPRPDLNAYLSSCRTLGVTVAYDAKAHADALQRVKALLTTLARPKP
jgi:dienelactone hydrolase